MTGQPTVRWHRFAETALIAGPATGGSVDAEAAATHEIPVFQRRWGGGPVLLTTEAISLAVAIPTGHPLWRNDLTESYAWLGNALAGACWELAIGARTIPVAEARADDPALGRLACYAGRSPYEVFVGNRKLWGLSQRRTQTTAIYVAGIYLDGDPAALADLLRGPAEQIAVVRDRLCAVATLAAIAPDLTLADIVAAVDRRLREAIGLA